MMDAMITRCVGELNKKDEHLRKQRIQQGGPELVPHFPCTLTAPSLLLPYSYLLLPRELTPITITTDKPLPPELNHMEHKLICSVTDSK